MSLLVFLSYSHIDRRLASGLKVGLEHYGFEVFLAHKDLTPSVEWQKAILKNLKVCQIFVPLLTKNFEDSAWTDQETGAAIILGKVIVPIRIDLVPYGFIHKYQALNMPKKINRGACWRIVKILARKKAIRNCVLDGYISVCLASSSFKEAAANFANLVELAPFSSLQLDRILEGCASNHQINRSWGSWPHIESLIENGGATVQKRLVKAYRKKVKEWKA